MARFVQPDSLPNNPIVLVQVGAQVMLIQNMIQGQLVNGSMGRVVAFDTMGNAAHHYAEVAKVDERTAKNAAKPVGEGKDESKPENRKWPIVEFENGHKLMCVAASLI
jgi:hypothetical protein